MAQRELFQRSPGHEMYPVGAENLRQSTSSNAKTKQDPAIILKYWQWLKYHLSKIAKTFVMKMLC
jgi:hypothetical protein